MSMMLRVHGLVGLEEGRTAPARPILFSFGFFFPYRDATVWRAEGSKLGNGWWMNVALWRCAQPHHVTNFDNKTGHLDVKPFHACIHTNSCIYVTNFKNLGL